MIHSSHSKKDLIEVIERFQLYSIINYNELRKNHLSKALWTLLETNPSIPEDTEVFYVSTIDELKDYLTKTSCKQITSNSVKYDVADRVKNLTYYVKGGFVFRGTNYENIDGVMMDAEFVRHFGDLPSVRRVLGLLNGDIKTPVKLQPVMTRRVEQRVKKRDIQKGQNTPKFHYTLGSYTIDFN